MIEPRLLLIPALCLYCCLSAAEFERHFPLPVKDNDLVGSNSTAITSASDTLVDIAARYQLGYNLVRSANPGVDAWLPGEGTRVVLPFQAILPTAPRDGIVINVAEMRLYFYSQDKKTEVTSVAIYPVSVGRGDWSTPVTSSRLTGRAKNPVWYPPKSIRAEHAARGDKLPLQVPPGPDNPLGKYMLTLDIPGYFIHGTNKQFGIGMQVTHGCIRMYPRDIEQLVKLAPNNTPVTIINQPFKTGWRDQQLYLEVHQPLEVNGSVIPISRTEYINALVSATRDRPDTVIDWDKLEQVISGTRGMPEKIGHWSREVSGRRQ